MNGERGNYEAHRRSVPEAKGRLRSDRDERVFPYSQTGGYSSSESSNRRDDSSGYGSDRGDSYRQSSNYDAQSEDLKVISFTELLSEMARLLRRMYMLPIILSLLFSAGLCYHARATYIPIYQASATFTVQVSNVSGANQSYSAAIAQQLSLTFPYIFTSGVLNNLIQQDLGLTSLPATITATSQGDTNLFTLYVNSNTPQMSYNILQSAIDNYPKVADFVVGNTTLTLLTESGIPERPANDVSYTERVIEGILWGCGTTAAFMLALALAKTRARNQSDLKSMLNLRCLGNVPCVSQKRRSRDAGRLLSILNANTPKSFIDAIRLIRSRIEKERDEKRYRVMLVTSSIPGEGKTTISTNIAVSLAMAGRSVALIDCDIRKPSSMDELTAQKDSGIVEYLNGLVSLDDIISYPIKNLIVVNGKTPSNEAAELLGSNRMKTLVDELLARVDIVLIDSPPAAVMADAVVLANLSDGIIYVIRQEFSRKNRILDGLRYLSRSNAEFMGYVLNSSNETGSGYGYGNYARYSRYNSYNRYGRYARYGSYDRYDSYSRYGKYGDSRNDYEKKTE